MRRAIPLALAALLLAGCASAEPRDETASDDAAPGTEAASDADALLEQHGLAGMATREIVDHLDALDVSERPTDLIASVRVDELLVSDGEDEFALALPDEEFYLSFAPYVEGTHDCFYHSLTTCLGELGDAQVQVTIVDDATGEVLVDEERTAFSNGFIGVWLPRDIDATLTVTHDGLTAETPISTGDEDATCLTTLQLT